MPRKNIIETSLKNRGAMIKVKTLEEAAEISNFISPEHLELSVDDPDLLVNSIKHAGAIFMGRNTCEAVRGLLCWTKSCTTYIKNSKIFFATWRL